MSDPPTELEMCMLAFALAFNDLKDLLLAQQYLGPVKPPQGITTAFGEYCGLMNHSHRYIVGVLHELFNLIRKKKTLFEGPEFASVLEQMGNRRGWWDRLAELANPADQQADPLFQVFVRIRNQAAFHFDQPKALSKAYKAYLNGSAPERSQAFYSLGDNMERTRFYFADAAGGGLLERVADERGIDLDALLRKALDQTNDGLWAVVKAYLELRIGSAIHTTWKGPSE